MFYGHGKTTESLPQWEVVLLEIGSTTIDSIILTYRATFVSRCATYVVFFLCLAIVAFVSLN